MIVTLSFLLFDFLLIFNNFAKLGATDEKQESIVSAEVECNCEITADL